MVYVLKNQNKGYSKAAMAHKEKHCTKCDSRVHTKIECWSSCTYCGKCILESEKCFHKDAPKKESSERASKAQNKRKNKRRRKNRKIASKL